MNIASIGIDLGKTTFHLVALGERNKILLRRKFPRSQLLAYTANLPASAESAPDSIESGRPSISPPPKLLTSTIGADCVGMDLTGRCPVSPHPQAN
jgi:hypothetical protein